MRQPTPIKELFAFYRASLAGEKPIAFDGDIHVGWYKTTLIKNGPWVPARVFIDRDIDPLTGELTRDELLLCDIHGIRQTEVRAMERFAFFKAITREEFDELENRWTHQPGDPRKPVNLSSQPTLPKGYHYA